MREGNIMNEQQDFEQIVANLEQALAQASPTVIPFLAGAFSRLQAGVQLRLMTCQAVPAPLAQADQGRYLTVEQVCERYNVSPKWLYRHKAQMPHSQPSRKVLLFPEKAIERWFATPK